MKAFLYLEKDNLVLDPKTIVVVRQSDRAAPGGAYVEMNNGFFSELTTPFDDVVSALLKGSQEGAW